MTTPKAVRWDRVQLEADIRQALQQTELDSKTLERFSDYLVEVYEVDTWKDLTNQRLIQVSDRLHVLSNKERRTTIFTKVAQF